MSDLFDAAKPARDIVAAELDRSMPEDMDQADRDGHRLGVHLIALLNAFLIDRHYVAAGPVRDVGLAEVITLAFGVAIANAATSVVPVRNGRPISGSANVMAMLGKIAQHACHQVVGAEDGLADIAVRLDLDAGGKIVASEADLSRFTRRKS